MSARDVLSFVFSRGKRHQETVSLTARMLSRMCETNRFRAFENAYLLERATARARKQLAACQPTAKSDGAVKRRAMRSAAHRLDASARPVPAMSNATCRGRAGAHERQPKRHVHALPPPRGT